MLVIKAGHLIDGYSDSIKENQVLFVEKDEITDIKPLAAADIPPDAQVIDHLNGYVMPGLIDCHVHLSYEGEADPRPAKQDPEALHALRAAHNARQTLAAGFTAVRNLGAPYDVDISLKRALSKGLDTGPRLMASGRCITITGGHGHEGGLEADSPWGVRKAVRTLQKAGADVIKVMATGGVMTEGVEPGAPELTLEELKAAAEEAHNAGRLTATHAQGSTGIRNAVEAGIDSIEHGIFLTEEIVEMMLAKNTAYVPTLSAPHHILANADKGIPSWAVEKTKRVAEAHKKSFSMAYEAGVRIGLGTDAGTPFNYHGQNGKELELMVEAGMKPMDAIKAGTSVAAEILGLGDSVGRLEAGYKADILLLNDDPLTDISKLQDRKFIRHIIFAGQVR